MRNKLTMTLIVGLARSGKSTYIKKHCKNDVIICPDRIRKLIFGHQFHKDAEEFIWAYAKGMAKLLLEQGKNVLIDATNLNGSTRDQWYRIADRYGAKIKIIWIKTSLEECQKRNAKSPKDERLPKEALNGMARIFQNPTEDSKNYGRKISKIVEYPYVGKYGDLGNIYSKERGSDWG